MVTKCSECGFEDCELAYTGLDGYCLCCECWNKYPLNSHHECYPCEVRRGDKEKILKQQTKLTEFID